MLGGCKGFTLIEVLVGMGLAATFVVLMGFSINQTMRTNTSTATRAAAMRAGELVLESLRTQPVTSLPSQPGATEVRQISVPSRPSPFNVTITYCAEVSLCPDSETRAVRVDVRDTARLWFSTETVFTEID